MKEQILHEGSKRVQQFLDERGSSNKVVILPESTATAQDAAGVLGVSECCIGKSIVFKNGDEVVVAVVGGDLYVDKTLLCNVLQTKFDLIQLKPAEVKKRTGYPIGGVSPFGLPSIARIFIDSNLKKVSVIFVAAGHPKAVVRVSFEELVLLSGANVAFISRNK